MESRLAQEVCALIKAELKRSKLPYRVLGERLGVSEVSVKRMLNSHQSLSVERLIAISENLDMPLSKLIAKAEKNLSCIPLFTKEQDLAFFNCPPLFTLWTELTEHRSLNEIQERHQLISASLYRYLRMLEDVGLVTLDIHGRPSLNVPTHTAFEQGAKYPVFFTSQVLNRLQQRVLNLPANDDQAFLTMLKAELTHEEFSAINKKLEDWMFTLLGDSQNQQSRKGLNVHPYTFGFMGAQGAFHDELPLIPNLSQS
ncbi:predicted transcriptional regulator [Vibrio maritimus]|uniref:Predicted transcriptional regulator n=1 Tax=Vibrio maritimus TaxID=990268 RepID=A0A090T9J9_9VIBR|nr:predicted transcriptional regulator [Vibrio maritimus]